MLEKIKQFIRFYKLKKWYEKYERVLIPATLIFGVIVDFLTFQNIDINTSFTLLSVYITLAGLTIAFINLYDNDVIKWKNKAAKYVRVFAPLVVQFAFGALLSASLVFYWSSGTFWVSWPFILIVIFLMMSNDIFREYYLKPSVQISVYFFILFSFSVLVLPFILSEMGPLIFVLSGVLSIMLIAAYIQILSYLVEDYRKNKALFAKIILALFTFMNLLYFANVIPPIPLSIRDTGVYHLVDRTEGGQYKILDEKRSWYDQFVPGHSIHVMENDRVYIFSSIFAPVDLKTEIIHHWQYYDNSKEEWVTADRLSFSILGGRDQGFRGYSLKSNIFPGDWRVDVETERGQVVGRINFEIVEVEQEPELKTIYK